MNIITFEMVLSLLKWRQSTSLLQPLLSILPRKEFFVQAEAEGLKNLARISAVGDL